MNAENIAELILYASYEGYQFVMIRDEQAKMPESECEFLARIASDKKIDIIYEIHKNPLDSNYIEVFQRGLRNVRMFKGPGILRTLVSMSEIDGDILKKGWTRDELVKLSGLCESSALEAMKSGISFIVENFNEAFFGDGTNFYGLAQLFENTVHTGLQFDISNPFRNTSRGKANPEMVIRFLLGLGERWVTTHLKTILEGEVQPVLTENPVPVETIVNLMGEKNIPWVALELAGIPDKEQCFTNHSLSIKYLRDKKILY